MKNVKIVYVMLAAMLIFSASASALSDGKAMSLSIEPRRAEFIFEPEVLWPPTKGLYIGSPTAIELPSGRILLAGVGKKTPRMFVSDDRGKTFTQIESFPHTISSPYTFGVGPSTLLRLADNRIALLMHRSAPKGRGGGLPAISFSSDQGKTWSKPTIVGSPEDEGSWYAPNDRMFQMKSGRLVVPLAFGAGDFEGHNNQGYCFFSDDGGVTWKKSIKPARFPGIETHGMAEPCVVERKDGSLLMLARTGKGSHHRSLSTDGGLTWSEPEPTTLISACSPSTLGRMPDGRLFVLYLNAKPVGNRYFPRNPMVYSVSDDDGETWSQPWIVDDETDRNYSNASILFLKEGILSIYHSELETEAFKRGQWGPNPPDLWKYGGGKRVLIKYP